MMGVLSVLVQALVLGICGVLGGRRLLHYFQLESYQLPGYLRSVKRNAMRTLVPPVAMAAAGVAALVLGAPVWLRLLLEIGRASCREGVWSAVGNRSCDEKGNGRRLHRHS